MKANRKETNSRPKQAKIRRKTPAINNFMGEPQAPKRHSSMNGVKRGLRIRSSYGAARVEMSPWITDVKRRIKRGITVQKGFEDSIRDLKRTKAYQIEFNLEELHQESKKLEDMVIYIKATKSDLSEKLERIEERIIRYQRYIEETQNQGIMKFPQTDDNLTRKLKKMYVNYKKELSSVKKEIRLLKQSSKYSEMVEKQIELEEAEIELQRLSEFYNHLKESYNFEELATENQALEIQINEIMLRNQALRDGIEDLERMEEMKEKEEKELKPLDEQYKKLLEERKQVKAELKQYEAMDKDNEVAVFLNTSLRYKQEAQELLEFLGENPEECPEILLIDQQIEIIKACQHNNNEKDHNQGEIVEEAIENEDEEEPSESQTKAKQNPNPKIDSGKNSKKVINKHLAPLESKPRDLKLVLLFCKQHLTSLQLQDFLTKKEISSAREAAINIFMILETKVLNMLEIEEYVKEAMMDCHINPNDNVAILERISDWVFKIYKDHQVPNKDYYKILLQSLREKNITLSEIEKLLSSINILSNEGTFDILRLEDLKKDLKLTKGELVALQGALIKTDWIATTTELQMLLNTNQLNDILQNTAHRIDEVGQTNPDPVDEFEDNEEQEEDKEQPQIQTKSPDDEFEEFEGENFNDADFVEKKDDEEFEEGFEDEFET